jgi:hypothetical protein
MEIEIDIVNQVWFFCASWWLGILMAISFLPQTCRQGRGTKAQRFTKYYFQI